MRTTHPRKNANDNTRCARWSTPAHVGCRSWRTKHLVAHSLGGHELKEMHVRTGGETRGRRPHRDRRPSKGSKTRAEESCADAVTGFKYRPVRSLRLGRRMLGTVVVRTGAGPARIARTHVLMLVMPTHLLSHGLPGCLHENLHRGTLHQHRPYQQNGNPLPPPGTPKWTGNGAHNPDG